MKHHQRFFAAIAVIVLFMFCFACAGKQKTDTATAPGAGTTSTQEDKGTGLGEGQLEEADVDTGEFQEVSAGQQGIFKDIYFDYDDFSLRPDAKDTLKGIAEWLLGNTAKQILIEGHCDERGTNEYNLALGERRANSAKKYLVQLGVSPKRVATITYGEERPLDSGHTESAWAKNRRDHFLMK